MFRAIFRSTEPMKSKQRAGKREQSEERNSSSEREEEVDEMSVIRRDPASVCPDVPTQQHDNSPHKNTASQSATNASLTRRRSWRLGLPFPRSAQFFRGKYSILRATHFWQRQSFICSGICASLASAVSLVHNMSTGSSNEMRILLRSTTLKSRSTRITLLANKPQ